MKKIINYILLILWLFFIFYLSSETGSVSGANSNIIIYNTLNVIYDIFNISKDNLLNTVDKIVPILRECMHSLEYFVLAILIMNLLRIYNVKSNLLFISVGLCFVYSATDEIHQLFVVGRTFEYFDIFMDFIGALIGSLLYKVWFFVK